MRIAIFSEVYWPMVSGVSLTLQRLTQALLERGHEARVYCATYPPPPGASDRPEVHRSPSGPLWISPEVQWASPDRLDIRRDLERFSPDLVHLATEFPMGYAGLRGARDLQLPIIASAHTDYERYASRYGLDWAVPPGWAYLRWFYRNAELVLCPSTRYEQHLRSRGVSHTAIWTRGVDTALFTPRHRSTEFRARLGIGPEDPLVLYVGRLAPEKGIDALLEAWEKLQQRSARARLLFVGGGAMTEAIRRRRLPGVELIGLLRGFDLSVAYASADVLAFPSVTETFGNVLLEGMASGLACVAVEAGGVTDFARHHQNALLTPPGNHVAFAEALARLLEDRSLRSNLAEGARATAECRGWGPIFDRLIEDYRRVATAEPDDRAA